MRFFNSKVLPEVYKGKYFITSEVDPDGLEMHSLRLSLNGNIETIGKFHFFETKKDAIDFIDELPEYLPEALHCAVENYNKSTFEEFLKHALTEPLNDPDNNYCMDSFCGACTWIILNYEKIDASFMKHYRDMYNERINE